MLQLNFCMDIATGYDVKYLLPVGIKKFLQANICFSSDQ